MKDAKVVTPSDMGDGIAWSETNKKFEAISQVFFTEREATVDLMINGVQLLFREVANSNRTMLATGVKFNDMWYGDAPDDTPATNPFTGQAISKPVPLTNNSFLQKTDLDEYQKKSDIDNRTIVRDETGKLQSQHLPTVLIAPFDAATSSITVETGTSNAVLFMSRKGMGTLKTIIGGVQGQIIYLRYVQGVEIEATNSIRLINGYASPTKLDSNKVSTFLCLAPSIWTEISRNFT